VGAEDRGGQRRAKAPCGLGGGRDHLLVAAVHAIEIADRRRRPAVAGAQSAPAGDYAHEGLFPGGRARKGMVNRVYPILWPSL
jgi:hypothetical protein